MLVLIGFEPVHNGLPLRLIHQQGNRQTKYGGVDLVIARFQTLCQRTEDQGTPLGGCQGGVVAIGERFSPIPSAIPDGKGLPTEFEWCGLVRPFSYRHPPVRLL